MDFPIPKSNQHSSNQKSNALPTEFVGLPKLNPVKRIHSQSQLFLKCWFVWSINNLILLKESNTFHHFFHSALVERWTKPRPRVNLLTVPTYWTKTGSFCVFSDLYWKTAIRTRGRRQPSFCLPFPAQLKTRNQNLTKIIMTMTTRGRRREIEGGRGEGDIWQMTMMVN